MTDPTSRTAYEILHVRDDAAQAVIDAAFRALARLHHPDRSASASASHRMAELNRAYAAIRTQDLREVYDRLRLPVLTRSDPPPTTVAPRAQPPQPDVLDFGRYEGWSLRDLARHDPDYLRWLSRHASGLRHRRRILELLDDRIRQGAVKHARR
jgi:curved DNA-binding protein CbpA